MLVLQFYFLDFSMLDVDCLDFAYPAKNPVNADFTEAKRNRQDAKKKLLHSDYCRYILYGKLPGSIF